MCKMRLTVATVKVVIATYFKMTTAYKTLICFNHWLNNYLQTAKHLKRIKQLGIDLLCYTLISMYDTLTIFYIQKSNFSLYDSNSGY